MKRKQPDKTGVVIMGVFIVASLLVQWFFRSKPAPLTGVSGQPVAVTEKIPQINIREDSLKSLLHAFLMKRNIDGPEVVKASGNYFEIRIGKAGDITELINNKRLLESKDQGFVMTTEPGGLLKASFPRSLKDHQYYVTVPADIVYRLFSSLN
ncbi:MAG: hypothetical protein WDO19_03965 [Bacteroidota bacterium]